MREIVLIKNGELALKGLNRSSFEDVLIKNMRRHLAPQAPSSLPRVKAPLWWSRRTGHGPGRHGRRAHPRVRHCRPVPGRRV